VVVDLDDGCRTVAEGHGHEFVLSRIEDYDPGEERFDLILAFNLIEHVARPRAVLGALAGLLAPGGRLVIKTPNVDAWDARIFRSRSWGGLHCPRHWVLFDEPSFREAAVASGLRVERFAYTQGAPFWAVNLAHELEVRGWWSRPAGVPIGRTTPYRAALATMAAFDTLRRPIARTSQMFVVSTRVGP
jgi:SAM-dependent methyltransferase